MRHIFSCEIDAQKRDFLLQEHSMEHLFSDVRCFKDGKAYCYVCKAEHRIDHKTVAIDVLASGTSCTDISTLNNGRRDFAGCYDENGGDADGSGSSGPTYLLGFKQAGVGSRHINVCIFVFVHIDLQKLLYISLI